MAHAIDSFHADLPPIRPLVMDRPWRWLVAGMCDMYQALHVSLAYGAIFALVGFGVVLGLVSIQLTAWSVPLAGGFMLVAPMLAVGLYQVSRQLQRGERPTLRDALTAWRTNYSQMALIGALLMFCTLAWLMVAGVLFMLFFSHTAASWESFYPALLASPNGIAFLLVGTAAGALLAATVFAISAVSIPMLLDRDTDAVTAMLTSITAVLHNWRVMGLWALMILALTVVGLATFGLGLLVIMPVIGHASWHAYQEIVGH